MASASGWHTPRLTSFEPVQNNNGAIQTLQHGMKPVGTLIDFDKLRENEQIVGEANHDILDHG